VREPRRGAFGRASGIAEGVAAAVRRRQQAREPRVLLYDSAGHPRLVPADSAARDRILELAEDMVVLVAPKRPERAPAPEDEETE
jgi:hypothetical protein